MNTNTMLFFIGIFLLVTAVFTRKRHSGISRFLFVLTILSFLGPVLLPRRIFGKRNVVKKLEGKQVGSMVLIPSEPGYAVNLTDNIISGFSEEERGHILSLLKQVEIYFPNHPMRDWETDVLFVTKDNDSLVVRVEKTSNNGTVIYTTGS